MSTFVRVLLAIGLATAALLAPAAASEPPSVVRVYYDDPATIARLARYDLWEFNDRTERFVLVTVDAAERAEIESLGFRVELDEARTAEINAERHVDPTQVTGIPGFPCYRTVEETYATAQQLVFTHAGLASFLDIGDSWDKENGNGGYDLKVLRLTNSAIPGPKPKLFVTGSIHAREYTPAELTTRFAEYLVDQYGVDADVTWILDYHEVHLMLQANPDGRKQAETGLFWRKNTDKNYCGPTSESRGADLNRNFEFGWGCCGGSSSFQCDETYRGPAPASEPETLAIQAHLLAEYPDQKGEPLDAPAPSDATGVYLDIHSSGQLVIWPWGFGGSAPNGTALRTLGRKLAFTNGYIPEQAIDLYVTDGTTIDFAYGDLGVAALAFELGTAFFQSCSTFEDVIVPTNMPALIYAAKVARTPYQTPAGPDALLVNANPPSVPAGVPIDLDATIDDTRYNQSNGSEPSQPIAAAEYYVDTPPWLPGPPTPTPMSAADGSFNATAEGVTATVATGGLAAGRHTIFVRGRDAAGNWGAFSAVFITIEDQAADGDGDGVANGVDCDAGDSTVWALPSPVRDLKVAPSGLANLTWLPPAQPGGLDLRYDVLRSGEAQDFSAAQCIMVGNGTSATDGNKPGSGAGFYYLVRVTNRCGENLGTDSAGNPHEGPSCLPPP